MIVSDPIFPFSVDLLAGQVNAMITTMASAGPHVKSGKLRALAVTGNQRNAEYPDVPTFAELDITGMDYEQWFGILGPANLPKPIVDRLTSTMARVVQMPDVRERLNGMALQLAPAGSAEMKNKLESDVARWQRLAKELDIKPLE